MGDVRWDNLFDDLEAQAASLDAGLRAAEVDERTRGEIGSLTAAERLRAAIGVELRLRLAGQLTLAATLARVGPDWLLLDEDAGRESLVVSAHVLGIRGLGRHSDAPGRVGVVESRLGLRHMLRGIARDRSACRLHLLDGETIDATIDRVGADFVEVAAHAAGELRRRADVRHVDLVPLSALVAIRRAG